MSFSLFDATVPTFQQTLGAMAGLLDKAEGFCTQGTTQVSDLLQARLADDMLPFTYQVSATVTHSVGALSAIRKGVFTPDRSPAAIDLARAARRPVASPGEPRLDDGGRYQQPCGSRYAI